MKPLDDLLKQARITTPIDPARRRRSEDIIRQDREFPGGWWHADDIDAAVDMVELSLRSLFGTSPLASDLVRSALQSALPGEEAWSGADDDFEDRLWERQVEAVGAHLNAALQARGEALRLWPFVASEPPVDDQPLFWAVLIPEERQRLIELGVLVAHT